MLKIIYELICDDIIKNDIYSISKFISISKSLYELVNEKMTNNKSLICKKRKILQSFSKNNSIESSIYTFKMCIKKEYLDIVEKNKQKFVDIRPKMNNHWHNYYAPDFFYKYREDILTYSMYIKNFDLYNYFYKTYETYYCESYCLHSGLYGAIMRNDIELINYFIEKIGNSDYDEAVIKSIMYGIMYGNLETFHYLYKRYNYTQEYSILYEYAVKGNNMDIIKEIFDDNFDCLDDSLITAINCGSYEIFIYLVERYNLSWETGIYNKYYICDFNNILSKCRYYNCFLRKEPEKIIKYFCNKLFLANNYEYLKPYIYELFQKDFEEIWRSLVNKDNTLLKKIIKRSIENRNIKEIDICIDINRSLSENMLKKSLKYSAINMNNEMIEYLINSGITNYEQGLYGAAKRGHRPLAKYFLELLGGRLDSNILNKSLSIAAGMGNITMVKFLIEIDEIGNIDFNSAMVSWIRNRKYNNKSKIRRILTDNGANDWNRFLLESIKAHQDRHRIKYFLYKGANNIDEAINLANSIIANNEWRYYDSETIKFLESYKK